MKTFPQMWTVWSKFVREAPFGASTTAFNTFEEMFNNTASIKALLQQMIIEASLMLASPLCNDTIVSLVANQGNANAKHSEDADNVLQGTYLAVSPPSLMKL